jgi:putative ABC transport system permease protein
VNVPGRTAHAGGGSARPRRRGPRSIVAAALAALLVAGMVIAAWSLGWIGFPALVATVASLPFVYLVGRQPVLRRLAVRNAVRRPRETILVVLGALLGTAIITSAYVVGDTIRATERDSAYARLGPVDELVVAEDAEVGEAAHAAISDAAPYGTDGTLRLLSLIAPVSTTGAGTKAEPETQVIETDFDAAGDFGGDPGVTGISGPTPSPGEAAVGADLANRLGVTAGDAIELHAYGSSVELAVTRVLARRGLAGLAPPGSDEVGSPNVFVAPGTLAALQGSAPAGSEAAPPTAVLAISNSGDVIGGATHTDAVRSRLARAVEGLPVRIDPAKQTLLDEAENAAGELTTLFSSFSYFSVLAGILLLVNIFVMLGQERKATLGMLRAVGLRRAGLVGSFSLEGWLYALASALAGALAGIGLGRLVVVVAYGFTDDAAGLHFSVTATSIETGFAAGFVIALATVVATSVVIARLHIIRAIRDLPEPPVDSGRRSARRIVSAVVGVAGAAVTVLGVAGSHVILGLIGPALAGLGVIGTFGPVRRRLVVSTVSTAVITWSVLCVSVLAGGDDGLEILDFVTQGVVLTAFAIALVSENQATIGAWVRAVGGGPRNLSLRLGLAYPLAKPGRTALTLGMYAVVVFVLTLLISVSSALSSQQDQVAEDLAGTAAIEVESNPSDPLSADDVGALPEVTTVAIASLTTAEFPAPRANGTAGDEATATQVVGFDETFIGHGSPKVTTRPDGATSDAAVYRSVLADPSAVLISAGFTPGGGDEGPGAGGDVHIGETITLRDPITGATHPLVVAGIVTEARYGGYDHVYVSRRGAEKIFGPRATSNLLYVTTTPGTDADDLAATINGRYLANGADANSFAELVSAEFAEQEQFLLLIDGYVGLGLLVGIAGLGVVMIRAVRERRHEVGVLRALGFRRVAVRRAFVTESSFIALEGITIGVVLALVTTWRLIEADVLGDDVAFAIPVLQLLPWVAGTLAVSLLATASPARQAARIRPAIALRLGG